MKEIDRRRMMGGILFGAAAAAGLALAPASATAMPLDDRLPAALDDWVEKAQAVIVRPDLPRRGSRRPRRRVWRCWWNRGRRICGWRWV